MHIPIHNEEFEIEELHSQIKTICELFIRLNDFSRIV